MSKRLPGTYYATSCEMSGLHPLRADMLPGPELLGARKTGIGVCMLASSPLTQLLAVHYSNISRY